MHLSFAPPLSELTDIDEVELGCLYFTQELVDRNEWWKRTILVYCFTIFQSQNPGFNDIRYSDVTRLYTLDPYTKVAWSRI